MFSLFSLIEQVCWTQQRKQETSASRLLWNEVWWNFNFFSGFTICPCAERYFRNVVCRLSYHASTRPLVWIRYSIRSPKSDAALHMLCVVGTHIKSLSRNDNNDRVLLHLYLLRTSDKKRKLRQRSAPSSVSFLFAAFLGARGAAPYNGLYGKAPPERGKDFELLYSLKCMKGQRNLSFGSVKGPEGPNR